MIVFHLETRNTAAGDNVAYNTRGIGSRAIMAAALRSTYIYIIGYRAVHDALH